MDFGIGEFISIEAIISFITSFFVSAVPEVSTEGMSVVIQDLLGDAGENIINLAEESEVIAQEENIPEINDVIVKLWEENQPLNQSQQAFSSNIKSIAKTLIDKGYNIDAEGTKKLLSDVVNKTIEYGKLHSKKILSTATIGGVFTGLKTIEKIKNSVKDEEKEVEDYVGFEKKRRDLLLAPKIFSNIPI